MNGKGPINECSFLCIIAIVLQYLFSFSDAGYCTQYYVCRRTGYNRDKYSTKCGFWDQSRCSKYRERSYTYYQHCTRSVCCSGYTGGSCSHAICFGSTTCQNGGTCLRPDYCTCPLGYSSPQCSDTNECASNNGGCTQTCTNTIGSYYCSCRNGFVLENGKICKDIDECAQNNGSCSHICQNTAGSFECACNSGFALDSNGKDCKEINECLTENGGCQHNCIDVYASFRCKCDPGYVLAEDGMGCDDINECSNSSVCSQICTNTNGSFNCSCQPGYMLGDDGKSCTDIDECAVNNGLCEQQCINIPSSHKCECDKGYSLNNDSETCSDIDECSIASPCSEMCNNTIGSFICSCPNGYELGYDGSTCIDINDCHGVLCMNAGTCIDLLESYMCNCKPGFEGDHCERDKDECAYINGGCDEKCVNTVGSFYCECEDGEKIGENGISCKSNGSITEPSVFEMYKISQQILPRGCAFIELATCKSTDSKQRIVLSSTSDWYSFRSNDQLIVTFGVVFLEINELALPLSISGLEVILTNGDITWKHESPKNIDKVVSQLQKNHSKNCFSFPITQKMVNKFMSIYLPTVFDNLNKIIPDWLQFGKSRTELLSVRDLRGDLMTGKEINADYECRGAPVFRERSYTVFRFGSTFDMHIYGNKIEIPKPLHGERFCIIIDICEADAGTIFFILPPHSRHILDHFDVFKSMSDSGLKFRPVGIGLSLSKKINVHYKANQIELWNGDNFMKLSPFPEANVWMLTDMTWQQSSKMLDLKVAGHFEMFFSFPRLTALLTGMFVDEWNVLVQLKVVAEAAEIRIPINKHRITLDFRNFAFATFQGYLSLGGQSERKWCGDGANPEGIFVSFKAGANPFKDVPIFRNWIFNANVKLYAFLAIHPNNQPTYEFSFLNILKGEISRLRHLVKQFVTNTQHSMSYQANELFSRLINETVVIEQMLNESVSKQGVTVVQKSNILLNIWSSYRKQWKQTGQEIISLFEYDFRPIRHNITSFIQETEQTLMKQLDNAITNLRNQTFSAFTNVKGIGIRFSSSITLLGLEFSVVDGEFVYSIDHIGQCSKFKKVYELLKGQSSIKFVGRSRRGLQLDFFFSLEASALFSLALSNITDDFVAHIHVHASILGLKTTGDLLISNKMFLMQLEGNIWDVFFARFSVSTKIGKRWYEHIYKVSGVLGVNTDKSFQNSYLDGLMKVATKYADKANERLSFAQDDIKLIQESFVIAQNNLESAKEKVRACNANFDAAVRSFDKAKERLERAKGPFKKAIRKLRAAQIDADNLCRIRTCHKICVPGLKIETCGSGWLKYPCISFTNCMFSIPDFPCLAINAACRIVRAAAFAVLEAAIQFVKAPILALDAAKLAVSTAQYVVDKSRVALYLAEGVLDVTKLGFQLANVALDGAKTALEYVKWIVREAIHVFELIVKYGIQNIIDVKNCKFELELSTYDKSLFDVSCDVKAFGLGWKTFGFEFDFRRPVFSMWNIARSTVDTSMSIIKDVFGRRKKRDIYHQTMKQLHFIIQRVKREVPFSNTTDQYFNDTMSSVLEDDFYLKNKFSNRVELFSHHCNMFLSIQSFLHGSISQLLEMANTSAMSIREIEKSNTNNNELDKNFTNFNLSIENVGISRDYALRDYNMTDTDLENIFLSMDISLQDDQYLLLMSNASKIAKDMIDYQTSTANSISIIDAWFNSLNNYSGIYFEETNCAGFHDCVLYSFSELHNMFEDNIDTNIFNTAIISSLEQNFQLIITNKSRSISNSKQLSVEIMDDLNLLNESHIFCSKAPVIETQFKNITALVRSTLRLHCEARGDPNPELSWYHNTYIIPGENQSTLVLKKIELTDSGTYQCSAGNIVTNVSTHIATVTIKECGPGLYYKYGDCIFCEKGFYQPEWNMKKCIKCPFGYSTKDRSSILSSDCTAHYTTVAVAVSLISSIIFIVVVILGVLKYRKSNHTMKIRFFSNPLAGPTAKTEFYQLREQKTADFQRFKDED